MKKIALAFALILTTPALAQQQQQPSTATERIALQIGQLVLQIEQQRDQIAALQKQLAEANAKADDKPTTPPKK